jgi:hypothetical protein
MQHRNCDTSTCFHIFQIMVELCLTLDWKCCVLFVLVMHDENTGDTLVLGFASSSQTTDPGTWMSPLCCSSTVVDDDEKSEGIAAVNETCAAAVPVAAVEAVLKKGQRHGMA